MNTITLTRKSRGRNPRTVEFQGVGRIDRVETKDSEGKVEVEEKLVTDGILTSVDDAVALPGIDGSPQKFLDTFVIGYNKVMGDAALETDEFATLLEGKPWASDEKRVDNFKRSVRAFAKAAEIEISEAAEIVLSKMK